MRMLGQHVLRFSTAIPEWVEEVPAGGDQALPATGRWFATFDLAENERAFWREKKLASGAVMLEREPDQARSLLREGLDRAIRIAARDRVT